MCEPAIFAALRTSLGLGLLVVSVAEMGGVYERSSGLWWSEGLGYRLFRSLEEARDALLLAALLVFALAGIAADRAFSLIWVGTGRLLRWRNWVRVSEQVRRVQALEHRPGTRPGEPFVESPTELRIIALSAAYDGRRVLNHLSLSVRPGETLVILAPSGSGKTTLIRAIGGFGDDKFRVTGQVGVEGLHRGRTESRVGLVLQEAPVFGHLTVWDNVGIGARVRALNSDARSLCTWALLNKFGLQHLARQRADQLSVGERQRLSLASALANRPLCVMLDEPFSSLDFLRRRHLQQFYREHVARKVTAIFVTHDLTEALAVGDEIRIGLAEDAPTMRVTREGTNIDEWEETSTFHRLRQELLTAVLRSDHEHSSRVKSATP